MRAEAVVAASAVLAGGRVTEIAEHESPPASGGIGIALHGIELGEVILATTVERLPIDGIGRERPAHVGDAVTSAKLLPFEKLSTLQLIQRAHRAVRAAR